MQIPTLLLCCITYNLVTIMYVAVAGGYRQIKSEFKK